uniref:Secreted protein n=1 Tax=Ixodes ricinus TaxID=34613 RepID=A0A6B0UQA9_IXORI
MRRQSGWAAASALSAPWWPSAAPGTCCAVASIRPLASPGGFVFPSFPTVEASSYACASFSWWIAHWLQLPCSLRRPSSPPRSWTSLPAPLPPRAEARTWERRPCLVSASLWALLLALHLAGFHLHSL